MTSPLRPTPAGWAATAPNGKGLAMADALGIRLEYDETPALSLGEVAHLWLGRGREAFCADYTASIDRHGTPEVVHETPEIIANPNPLPRNPDHEAFGGLLLNERFTLQDHQWQPYSAANWAWFHQRVRSPFHLALMDFYWIKDQGVRDGYSFSVALQVERDVDRPGRFAAALMIGRRYLYDESKARTFTDFMAEITAALPPVIGYTSESPTDDRKNTAQFGGPDLDPYRDDPAILKAFHWLTYATPQVIDALGGIDAIRAAGKLHAVRPLPHQAAILVATPTAREYTERAEAELGRYLKPVLPPTHYWWDTGNSNPYRQRRIVPR